jgi:lysophospholipid acyltransferase (LPLAT)-like uncharacterized protein
MRVVGARDRGRSDDFVVAVDAFGQSANRRERKFGIAGLARTRASGLDVLDAGTTALFQKKRVFANCQSSCIANVSSCDTVSERSPIQIRLLSFLASSYLRFVGATSRIFWANRVVRDRLESENKAFIYAFWHGRQVFLAYLHRGDRIRPVVSQSKDGELIARVCRSFGIEPVRGSSSKGGVGAMLEVQDALQEGARVGFTPDGPRGPLHSIQPGVLFVAQKTGLPIVPVAFGAKRKWIFGSWDRFIVPQPFNRIAMVYGNPIAVLETESLEERAQALKAALDAVVARADAIADGRENI